MKHVAVIGAGRWGKNIIATLQTLPDVTLAAVCVSSATELAGFTGDFARTTDYRSLLDQNLDAVCIATPGSTHAEVALPFIEQGLATFIEKPLTTDLEDAQRLHAAAKKSGALVSVGHVHLYNPAYQVTKELAEKAGKLRYLYFEGANNGPYRSDMSALWDWAPHDVAMAVDLTGTMPASVQAWGVATLRSDLLDLAMLKLTFPNDVTALITVSWLMPEKRKKLTIVGTTDSIVYDDTQPSHEASAGKAAGKVTFYKNMGPQVDGNTVTRQEPAISHPSYAAEPPLKLELQAFLDSMETKQPTRTPLEQGVAVVTILAAAEKSLSLAGQAVTV